MRLASWAFFVCLAAMATSVPTQRSCKRHWPARSKPIGQPAVARWPDRRYWPACAPEPSHHAPARTSSRTTSTITLVYDQDLPSDITIRLKKHNPMRKDENLAKKPILEDKVCSQTLFREKHIAESSEEQTDPGRSLHSSCFGKFSSAFEQPSSQPKCSRTNWPSRRRIPLSSSSTTSTTLPPKSSKCPSSSSPTTSPIVPTSSLCPIFRAVPDHPV